MTGGPGWRGSRRVPQERQKASFSSTEVRQCGHRDPAGGFRAGVCGLRACVCPMRLGNGNPQREQPRLRFGPPCNYHAACPPHLK